MANKYRPTNKSGKMPGNGIEGVYGNEKLMLGSTALVGAIGKLF